MLDFASGSGLVAVAAHLAGAGEIEACDLDVFAGEAIALNAQANSAEIRVRIEDLVGRDEDWDVILAGDVCYERDMAQRVVAWLQRLAARGADVLIGDPGRSYLPRPALEVVATYTVPTTRELEDSEVKRTSVWRLRGA